MERVWTFLDVGTLIKIAAAVVVALGAFGSIANPARADAGLTVNIFVEPDQATVGKVLTYTDVVTNTGDETARNVEYVGQVVPVGTPDSFTYTSSEGTCEPLSPLLAVDCQFGDLVPKESVTVTLQLEPTEPGTYLHQALARATNVSQVGNSIDTEVAEELGGEPGGDNGDRVLVEHNGKELCLPKAALNGHLKHGDEVISEEGCSDAKKGRNK